jgi:hypothetical protein
MRVFQNKWFNKWARGEGILSATLWRAAEEIVTGVVEADLGKNLYKKRIARPGQGKRGGYRLIVAYKKPHSDRIFYISAFEKSEKPNLKPNEQEALSKVALKYIEAADTIIDGLKKIGELFELEAPPK